MNTSELRPLTADEIDFVAGGGGKSCSSTILTLGVNPCEANSTQLGVFAGDGVIVVAGHIGELTVGLVL